MEASDSDQSPKTVWEHGWRMIRPAMVAWKQVTEQLLVLTQPTTEDKRDQVILEIEQRLDERDKLQLLVKGPFTQEEKVFGEELVKQEAELQKKLALFTKKIRFDISETQNKKDNMINYMNPYSKVARDGTFYDTKQ